MRLFVYSPLPDDLRAHLHQALPTATITHAADQPAGSLANLQQATVLFGNPPREWLAQDLPNLQLWQLDSAGFDRYQGLAVAAPVANMGDYFAWPCAETMVAGLLALYRALPELARLQAEQRWVGAPIRARMGLLRGKRVVILGAGTIGQAVRQQLSGFGCAVQLLARTDPQAQLHSREELLAVLPTTDIVVNCLPGSAQDFFAADLIAALPPHSIYASVGRGNTTDEPALIAALQAGRLAGAVLDVTATEPLPPGHPLWTLPTVLLTQHTGGGQPDEAAGKVAQLLRNLHRLQAGQPLENQVELKRGY
ncbi:D-2-hydroxyacid dehydrogenase [Hymenobacter sp. UV11]|uniref:D-2-hydroxyacid dehydrogenase n=1 Tax=Hymenobacter sp. UV11 TaxID=1849735 RepID=UPI00106114A3|nr:D-2-hydroxyacid dehydrogenase [Hymenobacter sp. UV11]TDN37836.1 hydroxyacid dehydrogenase [Hymenobacter sp. UV11]TFZ65046.1 D-2-hydroxyacid dehydrogenase [Hymenobacter sp. UV11]